MIWTGRWICVAILIQTLEYFFMPRWDQRLVRRETPKLLWPLLGGTRTSLLLQATVASLALALPHPLLIAVLILNTWLIALSWRGNFNGGSDFMTMQVLLGWFISSLSPKLVYVGAAWIVIQLILSYVVAGLVKVRNPDWRDGRTLSQLLHRYGWSLPLPKLISWGVISFECLFPLALYAPKTFIALGLVFHLANAFVFGLNRFFFAWAAAYPALSLVRDQLNSNL